MIFMFLFWFFLAHMIFALFLGLSTMTNITSSVAVFLTPNGLLMLSVGTLVGGVFALCSDAVGWGGVHLLGPLCADRVDEKMGEE